VCGVLLQQGREHVGDPLGSAADRLDAAPPDDGRGRLARVAVHEGIGGALPAPPRRRLLVLVEADEAIERPLSLGAVELSLGADGLHHRRREHELQPRRVAAPPPPRDERAVRELEVDAALLLAAGDPLVLGARRVVAGEREADRP
jgi:hypothetical protein